jgi:predicted DsbA family dithiol-disulfide isomerase
VHERLSVRVYYDFASSLCYVAHRVMERMAADLDALGIALAWRPIGGIQEESVMRSLPGRWAAKTRRAEAT